MQREISIADAAKMTVKQFTNRARYDKVIKGEFIIEKDVNPMLRVKNAQPGGFHYAYYEGEWDSTASFKGLKPQQEGITGDDFDIEKLPRKNNYALIVEGYLEAKEEGYYLFCLDADTGSKLYLDNHLLVRWEGSYKRRTFSYILYLKKGFYPLRLEYLHRKEDFGLKLTYLTPGIMDTKKPIPIPASLQYSVK